MRKIEFLQTQVFEPFFKKIFRDDIKYGIERGILPKLSKKTILKKDKMEEVVSLKRLEEKAKKINDYRVSQKIAEIEGDIDNYERVTVPTSTEVDISWPPIVSRKLKEETDAYMVHNQMGWASKRTIAGKLGYDYDEEQRLIQKEMEEGYVEPVLPEGEEIMEEE